MSEEKTFLEKEESLTRLVKPSATPDELYQTLIERIRKYHPSTDISMIEKAYQVAANAHKEQKRKSGEPYIIHPLSTAIILAELELDKETIAAGLLHDVVEDTAVTKQELEAMFGKDVAELVDGVTKLTRLSYDTDKLEEQAENLRKMFLAMAKDIRVILIKLADRLHNMRTLEYQTPEKQREKARETMDIYSPIAGRLGISKIKIELDDLSLMYLENEKYNWLVNEVTERLTYSESHIENLVKEVSFYMEEAGIHSQVNGRVKHYFSIYKKMVNQNKTLDQIYDIYAVRILVDSVRDCYAALGVIHENYKPIPGRFKDYIAMPKPNMYQSLHTTLIGSGQPFEIQIRTFDMHRIAEYGIAAHWKYKEGADGKISGNNEEAKLSWLRQILEWQQDMNDNKEFLNLLKSDLNLFSESVYCFTPTGDVKTLPNGSTPIDFAYLIHSAVGNKMVGARVDGKMVNIDYVLKNGDRVEIITSQNSKGPSQDWLKIVKSSQAKTKINQWFRTQRKEDNIEKGKDLLDRYCKSRGLNLGDLMKPEAVEKVLAKYSFRDWDSVVAAVGHGGLKEGQIVNKLIEERDKQLKKEVPTNEQILDAIQINRDAQQIIEHRKIRSKSGITVKGLTDVAVRFSKCCSPVPGDEIVGFITRGRGVSIHRTDCINMMNLPELDRVRLIEADWDPEFLQGPGKYMAEITIYANNRTGLLADISHVMTERNIDIKTLNTRTNKDNLASIGMSFEIGSVEELNQLINKIMTIESVVDVERTTG